MTPFIISIGCCMCTQPVKYIISILLLIFNFFLYMQANAFWTAVLKYWIATLPARL